ncbi:MAG: radical SAM/SPASM domain-containing protein [Desulfobacteraceae bacterium]
MNIINRNYTKTLYHHSAVLKKLLVFYATNYYSSYPKAIVIELSNRCNLKCRMCWFHGENGIGDRYRGAEIETAEVLRFFKEMAPYKPKIYLGGSEPFIRDDFMLLLEYLKSHNFPVSFATNGTLLDAAKIKKLTEIGVDDIKFSIDGNQEIHDYIRGKGVFKKVTQAVKEMAFYKNSMASKKPIITINITITNEVYGRLKPTIAAIRKAVADSADCYRLHHLWYVTENELFEHQSAIHKALGCKAAEAKAHLINLASTFNPKELANEIADIRRGRGVSFFPNLQYSDIINYYSEGLAVKARCSAPFSGAVIKPNGDVKFCPDAWIDDYVIGNIRQERFMDIWNNKKARRFRKIIMKQKQFAGCKRCSWMYSFNLF